jgi:hypothetical protein
MESQPIEESPINIDDAICNKIYEELQFDFKLREATEEVTVKNTNATHRFAAFVDLTKCKITVRDDFHPDDMQFTLFLVPRSLMSNQVIEDPKKTKFHTTEEKDIHMISDSFIQKNDLVFIDDPIIEYKQSEKYDYTLLATHLEREPWTMFHKEDIQYVRNKTNLIAAFDFESKIRKGQEPDLFTIIVVPIIAGISFITIILLLFGLIETPCTILCKIKQELHYY